MKEQLMKKTLSELQEILKNDIETAFRSDSIMFFEKIDVTSANTESENEIHINF